MADLLMIIKDGKLLAEELACYFGRQDREVALAGSFAQAASTPLDHAYDPPVSLAEMTPADGHSLAPRETVRRHGQTCEWILLTGYAHPGIAARPAVRQVRQLSGLVEVAFRALVISGETGTGKGLVARLLRHSGPRADAPLSEVNRAALPRDLLESEPFGREAGAFTGAKVYHRGYLEQADGGALFLDEIVEMGLDLQAKLLSAVGYRGPGLPAAAPVQLAGQGAVAWQAGGACPAARRRGAVSGALFASRRNPEPVHERRGPSIEGSRLIVPLDGSVVRDEMDGRIIQTELDKTGGNIRAAPCAIGRSREALCDRIRKYPLRTRPQESGSDGQSGAFPSETGRG
jgi:transcriptional regulator of acetoin/glycerol metabolism